MGKSKNALVLGGSGHIGNAITRALLDRGLKVTACGRRQFSPPNLAGLRVEYLSGDADTPGQLARWIEGHDLVVDAAAPYLVAIPQLGIVDAQRSNPVMQAERRTRLLLNAVSGSGARLIYIGSFVTLARPRNEAQRLEAQMMRLAHPYFEVKELIENEIIIACRRGLRAVIVDPTYCLGPWDLHDREICTIPLLISGEVPGSITQMLNVVDVREVAALALAALETKRYGEPLLAAGHAIGASELYGLICDLGGVPRPRFLTRTRPTILGAYLMEMTLGIIGRRTALPVGGMMMAAYFDQALPESALGAYDIKPRPLQDTVIDAIGWYRQIAYC